MFSSSGKNARNQGPSIDRQDFSRDAGDADDDESLDDTWYTHDFSGARGIQETGLDELGSKSDANKKSDDIASDATTAMSEESRDRNSAFIEAMADLLDDRQGMNNSEQQFTKGESANRESLDGSIISEFRYDGKKYSSATNISSSRKDKQKRSKSPSQGGSIRGKHRHPRRGFLGLASKLKLTRKHKSIAKLQLSILNSGCVSLKSLDRDLQTFLPRERLNPKEFESRCKLMRKYEVLATIEYRFASRYETYVCRHANQESNQSKNNSKKCVPYDYNRVILKTIPDVADSDYINASYVDSCLKPNAYIAAQGPNESTLNDFWRMIWEQKTFVIVMLTKVFDFIKVMCNQYWPVIKDKPERYGNLEVTLLYEEPLADFVIRTIRLARVRTSQANETTEAAAAAATTTETDKPSASPAATNLLPGGIHKIRIQDENGGAYDDDFSDDDNTSAGSYNETDWDDGPSFNEYSTPVEPNCPSPMSGSSLPTVRAPRYAGKHQRKKHLMEEEDRPLGRRSSSVPKGPLLSSLNVPPSRLDHQPAPRSASQPSNPNHLRPRPANLDISVEQRRSSNLNPLLTLSPPITASSETLSSMPPTPTSPRTPSSAGIDRSSATRKAVKKKKRARIRNARPMRTQFQVPDESQLLDDDELFDEEGGGNNNDGDQTADVDLQGVAGNGFKTGAGTSSERIIYQFHYNGWASHTCPFTSSLLHFRRRVRICMDEMAKSGKTGPTVVHCNDGCGRTGTYLCIDANLELAEEDNVYDVYRYTRRMRQSRRYLIENLEQYKFVYDTIEEAMYCGKTWFPLSELSKRLKHKSQRNPITKKNEYLREYEKITRMATKFSIGDCAGGHRVENREKNRDVSTVPPDNFRPYLTSFQTNDNTDYINAVFVDGYTRSKEYIVTEWPVHKTISDFWSLIYDHDCNSVILLANPGETSAYPSFLPTEKELRRKFGPVFSAEMVSYTHYQNIKSWIYTINKKIVSLTEVISGVKSEAKTTQVFQITCWPQGHRVPTSTNALVELMNMVERWRQRTAYGPVCVVSLDGKSRAGVYCAANVAIEQVVQHNEVDVFQAVKTVRRHRPQLVENMTEYKYCYDLILHYVLHYLNQSPATS